MPIEKPESRISVRVTPEYPRLKKRLKAAAKIAGVTEARLVLASVIATIEFIEQHGKITLPITLGDVLEEQAVLARLERFVQLLHESH